jgi:hypothetical protein
VAPKNKSAEAGKSGCSNFPFPLVLHFGWLDLGKLDPGKLDPGWLD